METTTMGKVVVPAKMENLDDLFRASRGEISRDAVRCVEVNDALVDTGASMLLVPASLIQTLGLTKFMTPPSRTLGGPIEIGTYSSVRLNIHGRECHLDVGEISDGYPVIVGQIPLEMLDFIVDPKGQRLIGNPEHGGQHMIDAFYLTDSDKMT